MSIGRETLHRIQPVYRRRRTHHVSSESRDTSARSGVQKTGRPEPAKTRAEAETKSYEAFRFGPRGKRPRLIERRFFSHLANKLGISEPPTDDLRNRDAETFGIAHHFPIRVLAIVVPESLFVHIS